MTESNDLEPFSSQTPQTNLELLRTGLWRGHLSLQTSTPPWTTNLSPLPQSITALGVERQGLLLRNALLATIGDR